MPRTGNLPPEDGAAFRGGRSHGLVTSAGLVDLVVEPKGFESGYAALIGKAITVDVAGTTVRVGALHDLIVSKQLLGREKDREHLPLLLEREAQLDRQRGMSDDLSRGPDDDMGLAL